MNMQAAEHPVSETNGVTSRSWGDTAVTFAARIARADYSAADLADLRRMNPGSPAPAAFWRHMAEAGLLDDSNMEAMWLLILHGIALMTRPGTGDGQMCSAHDGGLPVGRALYLGGNVSRGTAFYSEARLGRLLIARGPMLRMLLARAFRMLATAGVRFNWREMARFILNEGYDSGAAEQSRRLIAREYYLSRRLSSSSPSSGD